MTFVPSTARTVKLPQYVGYYPTIVLRFPIKSPGQQLDYSLDVSALLADDGAEGVASCSVAFYPAGPAGDFTIVTQPTPGPIMTMVVAGGALNTDYATRWTFVTDSVPARTYAFDVWLMVMNQASSNFTIPPMGVGPAGPQGPAGIAAPIQGALLTLAGSDQLIPNQTLTLASWDTEVYSVPVSGFWTSSQPTRLIVPEGISKVRLTAQIQWSGSNAAGARTVILKKNGAFFGPGGGEAISDALSSTPQQPQQVQQLFSAILNVVAGDYFELVVVQTSSASDFGIQGAGTSWFQIEVATGGLVGPPGPAGPSNLINDLGLSTPSMVVDVTDDRVFTLTLNGSITSFNLTTETDAGIYLAVVLALTQGGVGGNTINWPANFRWQGGFSPSLSTAVGATDIVQAVSFDAGASWIAGLAAQAAP